VNTGYCLILDGWIPPAIMQDHVIGRLQVESDTSGAKRHHHAEVITVGIKIFAQRVPDVWRHTTIQQTTLLLAFRAHEVAKSLCHSSIRQRGVGFSRRSLFASVRDCDGQSAALVVKVVVRVYLYETCYVRARASPPRAGFVTDCDRSPVYHVHARVRARRRIQGKVCNGPSLHLDRTLRPAAYSDFSGQLVRLAIHPSKSDRRMRQLLPNLNAGNSCFQRMSLSTVL